MVSFPPSPLKFSNLSFTPPVKVSANCVPMTPRTPVNVTEPNVTPLVLKLDRLCAVAVVRLMFTPKPLVLVVTAPK